LHNFTASSVKEYAYSEDKNFKFRPAMEDSKAYLVIFLAYCIKDKLGNDPNVGLFAIFDGHGGKQVADHCAERIHEELRKEIAKNASTDLSQSIEQVFLRVSNIIVKRL
jgi:serine/threonine protein phosphatase PrpC